MTEWTEPLSPQGERRREAIAEMARHAARGRRQRRVVVRGVCGSVVAAVVVLLVVHPLARRGQDASPSRVDSVVAKTNTSDVAVARIETESGITQRLSFGHDRPRWQAVGDDDLLRTLAQAGHPAGLVEMNGEARLLLR